MRSEGTLTGVLAALALAIAGGEIWAAPPAAGSDPAPATHELLYGETIWSLSRHYGTSVEAIVEANGIENVRRVRAGRRLIIPLAKPREEAKADPAPEPETGPAAPSSTAESGPADEEVSEQAAEEEALDALVERAAQELREARFEEALATVESARSAVSTLEDSPATRAARARLETLAGTAEVALTRYGDAMASFARALEADPALRLDRASTSPKVVRVFEEARARSTPIPPGP